jgi:adenylate cyclase
MSPANLSSVCLAAMDTAVALASSLDWSLLFENRRFATWFPADGGRSTLFDRVPGFDADKVRTSLEAGRTHRLELEVANGARTLPVRLTFRATAEGGGAPVMVEGRDIGEQKQAEYMLDSYSRLAEKHARDLRKEKERAEKLLLNIMPRTVYEELRDLGTALPQRFEAASVLLLDFVGFTTIAETQDAAALVVELNDIFSGFDRIVELFGCERIKTIGDAYLAVSGLPEASPEHAVNLARAAVRMRRYLDRRNATHASKWQCRIGLRTGPVIGSLIGVQKYVYDVFGPTVNLASRLQCLCKPMQITVCQTMQSLLRDHFHLEDRGEFELKGMGTRRVHVLNEEIAR